MTVATPWQFSQIEKQEVTKFGSHSLSGFKVAVNTMVLWDKSPPPVGNRVKRKKMKLCGALKEVLVP